MPTKAQLEEQVQRVTTENDELRELSGKLLEDRDVLGSVLLDAEDYLLAIEAAIEPRGFWNATLVAVVSTEVLAGVLDRISSTLDKE